MCLLVLDSVDMHTNTAAFELQVRKERSSAQLKTIRSGQHIDSKTNCSNSSTSTAASSRHKLYLSLTRSAFSRQPPSKSKPQHIQPHGYLFQLSPAELAAAKEYIQDLLKKGEIRPSKSPYGASLFFVKEKGKSLRGFVDYRALNRITKRNNTLLPRSDEMFDQLGGARVFSKLDLKTGFTWMHHSWL